MSEPTPMSIPGTKHILDDFAIFGGTPAFAQPVHVGRPNIGDRDAFLRRVNGALDRRWLSNNGVLVQEFERRVESMLGVKHCVAMCNATLALEVAAKACGLTGEVIVPAFTFVATPHALDWIGLTPVFCDIDPRTHNIDPQEARRLVTDKTSAIIGVHVWGRPCDVEGLQRIADEHNLALLFDAAHAFGCSTSGKAIGNFGRAEVFSFHATKFVNSFEGGALTTNDDTVAARARLLCNFGFAGVDRVVSSGTNAKMTEVCAAMGLTSIDSLPAIVDANAAHYADYSAILGAVPGVTVAAYDQRDSPNYQYVIIEIDESVVGISRDDLRDVLWAENVHARRYFYPGCHRMEPYVSRPGAAALARTDQLCERVLSLPSGTALTRADVGTVGRLILTAIGNGPKIHERLGSRPRCAVGV